MNSILNIKNGLYILAALFIISCDEGKIYPDDTVDSGRTATVTLTFDGLGAWPKKNYLSLVSHRRRRLNNHTDQTNQQTV